MIKSLTAVNVPTMICAIFRGEVMAREFYIFQNCRLSRKDNNILIENERQKRNIRSEVVENIYVFGEVDLNTKFLNFIGQKGISLHVFNYYGFYSGSYWPRKKTVSGDLLVKQVSHYMDQEERLYIAKELIYAASHNIQRNMRYYKNRGIDLEDEISTIEALIKRIEYMTSVEGLMGIEGNIRRNYYRSWNKIVRQNIDFKKRVRRPPDNMINSMISYLNSLFYTTVLSEIYKTQLNPTISYLHEPGVKRFSLALDLSEVFKPLVVDRLIFSLLNRKQIVEEDFEKESNYLYLKDKARKEIIVEYDKALGRTIKHKELGREVSYRYLIRLECYKLIKHLIGEKEYGSFKMWW